MSPRRTLIQAALFFAFCSTSFASYAEDRFFDFKQMGKTFSRYASHCLKDFGVFKNRSNYSPGIRYFDSNPFGKNLRTWVFDKPTLEVLEANGAVPNLHQILNLAFDPGYASAGMVQQGDAETRSKQTIYAHFSETGHVEIGTAFRKLVNPALFGIQTSRRSDPRTVFLDEGVLVLIEDPSGETQRRFEQLEATQLPTFKKRYPNDFSGATCADSACIFLNALGIHRANQKPIRVFKPSSLLKSFLKDELNGPLGNPLQIQVFLFGSSKVGSALLRIRATELLVTPELLDHVTSRPPLEVMQGLIRILFRSPTDPSS